MRERDIFDAVLRETESERSTAYSTAGPDEFTVSYWGKEVVYHKRVTRNGCVAYHCDNNDAHRAARALQVKAVEKFKKAAREAGITRPNFNEGGLTSDGFIPTGSNYSD